jgi:hypothetical protein
VSTTNPFLDLGERSFPFMGIVQAVTTAVQESVFKRSLSLGPRDCKYGEQT